MSLPIVNELLIIIIAAFVGGLLARAARLPPITGYIGSGILFGIIGSKVFPSYSTLLDLSQIGVALLLFTLGFEISLDTIKSLRSKILWVGVLQVVILSLVLFPLLVVFQFGVTTSLLFSILFSFSSTAVVVKLLEEKGMLNDFPGNNIFVFLLIQDLFVIPVIFFLPILFSKTGISLSVLWGFALSLGKTVVIFIALLWLSRSLIPKLMNIAFRYPSHELNILATIFVTVTSIGILTQMGVPIAIASFFAGVLLSEEGKNIAPLSEIRPFRDIFLVLFFVTTGMLIDSSYVVSHFVKIVGITFFIIIVKFTLVYITLRFSAYLASSAVFIASYLANIGEFAAVIGQVSFISGYITQESYNILLSSFVLSLVLVPFSLRYLRFIGSRFSSFKILYRFFGEPILPSSSNLEQVRDHVVICGHGRVGSKIRTLLDFIGIEYVVADFNRNVVLELRKKNKRAIYGDPTDTEVLLATGVKWAKIIIVAVPDKVSQKKIIKTALTLNSRLIVICRSHTEGDRYELVNLGANSIVIPEFEAGVRIGVEALRFYGVRDEIIFPAVKLLRKEFPE